MNKRQLLSLLLSIALAAGILSGCGGEITESTVSASASTAVEPSAPEPDTSAAPGSEETSSEESLPEPVMEPQWPEEPVTLTMYKPAHPALCEMIEQGYGIETWSVWN